jgi:hypothetical protein
MAVPLERCWCRFAGDAAGKAHTYAWGGRLDKIKLAPINKQSAEHAMAGQGDADYLWILYDETLTLTSTSLSISISSSTHPQPHRPIHPYIPTYQ